MSSKSGKNDQQPKIISIMEQFYDLFKDSLHLAMENQAHLTKLRELQGQKQAKQAQPSALPKVKQKVIVNIHNVDFNKMSFLQKVQIMMAHNDNQIDKEEERKERQIKIKEQE